MSPLPEGSLFALLAEHSDRIVRDEYFAECYSERINRPVDPAVGVSEGVVVGVPVRAF